MRVALFPLAAFLQFIEGGKRNGRQYGGLFDRKRLPGLQSIHVRTKLVERMTGFRFGFVAHNAK